MMQPKMASMPAPTTKSPTKQDYDQVVEAQATKMEDSLDALAPVTDYSAPRLSALAKALDAVVSLFSANIPPTPVSPAISKGKLPTDYLVRIAACKAAADAFNAAHPDEAPVVITDIPQLVGDAPIAMLAVTLQKLAADKAFKSWLKQPAPAHAEPHVEAPHKGEAADLSQEQQEQLSTVFPTK